MVENELEAGKTGAKETMWGVMASNRLGEGRANLRWVNVVGSVWRRTGLGGIRETAFSRCVG